MKPAPRNHAAVRRLHVALRTARVLLVVLLVAGALGIGFAQIERSRLSVGRTSDPAAFRLYLDRSFVTVGWSSAYTGDAEKYSSTRTLWTLGSIQTSLRRPPGARPFLRHTLMMDCRAVMAALIAYPIFFLVHHFRRRRRGAAPNSGQAATAAVPAPVARPARSWHASAAAAWALAAVGVFVLTRPPEARLEAVAAVMRSSAEEANTIEARIAALSLRTQPPPASAPRPAEASPSEIADIEVTAGMTFDEVRAAIGHPSRVKFQGAERTWELDRLDDRPACRIHFDHTGRVASITVEGQDPGRP